MQYHQPLVKSPETPFGAKPITVFARAIDLKSDCLSPVKLAFKHCTHKWDRLGISWGYSDIVIIVGIHMYRSV